MPVETCWVRFSSAEIALDFACTMIFLLRVRMQSTLQKTISHQASLARIVISDLRLLRRVLLYVAVRRHRRAPRHDVSIDSAAPTPDDQAPGPAQGHPAPPDEPDGCRPPRCIGPSSQTTARFSPVPLGTTRISAFELACDTSRPDAFPRVARPCTADRSPSCRARAATSGCRARSRPRRAKQSVFSNSAWFESALPARRTAS